MPADRSQDRHHNPNYPYRPTPPDLLGQLDAAMGAGKRSWVISNLVARFLGGQRMPTRTELLAEWDKRGQRHDG